MNTHFSKASFYKNLVALHSYLKQIRLINGQRVTRPTCLLCLAQLLQANTLNHAHTHTSHATRKRAQYTCPKHGSVHRLSKKPLPAHGGLASFSSENPVVVLHRHQPPNRKARAACAENTLTGVVPLASAPAAMTTIMQMMTKVVTQRSAVFQSIWPPIHH